jgi:hypothetical protein
MLFADASVSEVVASVNIILLGVQEIVKGSSSAWRRAR